MEFGLTGFRRWLVAWQRRHGTTKVVLVSALISCIASAGLCYPALIATLGNDYLFGDGVTITVLLPILVPMAIAPMITYQIATALETAANVIDILSATRSSLELEVAARKEAQSNLEHLARTDALTGVLNRRGFFDALDRLSLRQKSMTAVVIADIDSFKSVNDSLGHAAGDSVLKALAHRLTDAAGDGAIVARLGGDEFVAALLGGSGGDQIRRNLAEFTVDDVDGIKHVCCSVGVALHQSDDDIETTLAKADAALYRDKATRRASYGDTVRIATESDSSPNRPKTTAAGL